MTFKSKFYYLFIITPTKKGEKKSGNLKTHLMNCCGAVAFWEILYEIVYACVFLIFLHLMLLVSFVELS